MYLLSPKQQIRLWHCRLGHASNIRVIQTSKLADGINFGGEISSDDEVFSSNSKPDKEDAKNESAPINEVIDSLGIIEQLYVAYVKSKYIRMIKSKSMTLTTRKLQEIYIDL